MNFMNVIIMYLYESINNDVYMKISKGFKLLEIFFANPHSMYSIKLQQSL